MHIRRYKSRENLIKERERWNKRKLWYRTKNDREHKSHPLNQSISPQSLPIHQPPQQPPFNQQPLLQSPQPLQHIQKQPQFKYNQQPPPPLPSPLQHIQPHPRCRNYYYQKGYEPNTYEHQLMLKQNNQKYRSWATLNPNTYSYMHPS